MQKPYETTGKIIRPLHGDTRTPLQCKLLIISHIDTFVTIPYINLSQDFIVLLTKGKHTAALFKRWKVEDGGTAHTTLTKPMTTHTEVITTVRFYSCSILGQMFFGVFFTPEIPLFAMIK